MALFKDESEKAAEPGLLSRVQHVQPPAGGAEDMPPSSNQAASTSRDRTYLDQGCRINGKLIFETPVRIDGQVEGEIDAHDTSVTVGKSAVVTAKIKAVSVTVAGVVNGDISASQRIELQPSAKVTGSLAAPKLVVLEGALFDGTCTMSPKVVRDERKPGTGRREERLATEVNAQEPVGQA